MSLYDAILISISSLLAGLHIAMLAEDPYNSLRAWHDWFMIAVFSFLVAHHIDRTK